MAYTFCPETDFVQLEKSISSLYGEQELQRESSRYRRLLQGLKENFGPC